MEKFIARMLLAGRWNLDKTRVEKVQRAWVEGFDTDEGFKIKDDIFSTAYQQLGLPSSQTSMLLLFYSSRLLYTIKSKQLIATLIRLSR